MAFARTYRAALPTLFGFVALGLFWGAWASVLPSVQRATNVSKGALGFALLFVTVGSLPSMFFLARPAVDRFGGRTATVSCALFAAATTLPGLATSLPALAGTLFLAGAASGALDVGINANAAALESAESRRLMPLAHGLYSAGVLLGAVAAGLARAAGVHREPILLVVAAVIALAAALLALDRQADHVLGAAAEPAPRIRIPRALLAIGAVGALAFMIEGGSESWSALFLERQLHAHPGVSGLGPGVFGASMAVGRFYGQATRFGDRALLAGGALVAAAGCAVVAGAPGAWAALLGLALAGIGIALNAPILFGAAGRVAPSAVATVTTLGYVGLLVGPPLVGGIAQLTNLRGSFLLLAAAAAGVAAAASRLRL
ncbi:MAG TPA: MFS transporter [Gaiellaceae bacterium]|nr:MFS transporter [Gaiellaceae bacterium]